jgi:hypothetical protein
MSQTIRDGFFKGTMATDFRAQRVEAQKSAPPKTLEFIA